MGPRPSLDELEALEPVERADAPGFALELGGGLERPPTPDPQELEAPALFQAKRFQQLDLFVLLEQTLGDESEYREVLRPDLERHGLHRELDRRFRYEP